MTAVIEWRALAPVLLVLVAAILGILVEAMMPRAQRFFAQVFLTIASVAVAAAFLVANWRAGVGGPVAMGSMMLDGPTYFMWGSLLVLGLIAILVMAERQLNGGVSTFAASAATVPGSRAEAEASAARLEHTEVFPLALFALGGMMVFPAASDLITMFVALEVFSLPLYLMCGMARRRRLLSQEAALKYFLLGAFSSAFFLFGVALLYGFAGSFDLKAIADAVQNPTMGRGILVAGMAMLGVGLLFKIGVVPFHNWTPDVYMGAPTPITGFMAICTKLASVGATLRVFYVALAGERWSWQPLLAVLIVLTMVVGSIWGLTQTDMKRTLAYSSIAHAGFIMTAVVGASTGSAASPLDSVASAMFYLVVYGLASIGAFAIITMVRNPSGEANSIDSWSGLGRKSPLVAGIFALFMLSFTGIPLTGGFIGKWAVFAAAWRGGFDWLVIVAVVLSLVAAVFYLRIIVVMFFREPAVGVMVGKASAFTWLPILVSAVGIAVLGVFPGPILDLATAAGTFLR
ncbi:MAG: NADH-quinone oxidoreductase subunit NuoN [Micropruina sp.]|uniref:NADH-quinone oxidoreductase subunit NuoN n=1 Tax=Micropruina sp. TaxID=2737536 RepID=UPI0039E597F9